MLQLTTRVHNLKRLTCLHRYTRLGTKQIRSFFGKQTTLEEDEFAEQEKIEELRQAFSLPRNAWFTTDHHYLQPTSEDYVWKFGITTYLKTGMAHVFMVRVNASVGEEVNYMSGVMEMEFDPSDEGTECLPTIYIPSPPVTVCTIQTINWELVHQPRKITHDMQSCEWLLEIWCQIDPSKEEAVVNGRCEKFMNTEEYVKFLLKLDPRDMLNRFPGLNVHDEHAVVFTNNTQYVSGDTTMHKTSRWKPDWWPWGM